MNFIIGTIIAGVFLALPAALIYIWIGWKFAVTFWLILMITNIYSFLFKKKQP